MSQAQTDPAVRQTSEDDAVAAAQQYARVLARSHQMDKQIIHLGTVTPEMRASIDAINQDMAELASKWHFIPQPCFRAEPIQANGDASQ